MALDSRALRTFLAVCRAGSISEAARRLNISQPAVSASMGQLELSLDARLFTRARSGIALTPTGEALRSRAEAMETLLAQAEREVTLVRQEIAGPLLIGGTPGALASLLPPAVERVKQQHPAFELQVFERADEQLTDLLRGGRIDFAIVTTGLEQMPSDIIEEPILRDPFALLVGRQNGHLPNRVSLAELGQAHWVLPRAGGAFRRQVDALFIAADARVPANVIRCDSLLTTKAIIRRTDCVTILPREVASQELATGEIRAIEIEGAAFLRSVGVRRVSDRPLSPLAAVFLAAIRGAALT